eukprot:g73358.t1
MKATLLSLLGGIHVLGQYNKVLLKDVTAITLQEGRMTAGRRSSPVQQLACVGGSCSSFQPSSVVCMNIGFDGSDVQWKCEADFPDGYSFGRVTVGCEGYGYDYPEDPYILKDSCGLEYTVKSVPLTGGSGYGNDQGNYNQDSRPWQSRSQTWGHGGGQSQWAKNLMSFIVLGLLVYVLKESCCPSRRGGGYGGEGGGGGGGGGGDQPGWGGNTGGGSGSYYGGSMGVPGVGRGGYGGFMGGMGLGGALGYMLGRRNAGGGMGYGGNNMYGTGNYGYGGATYRAPMSTSFGGGSRPSSATGGTVRRAAYGGTTRR